MTLYMCLVQNDHRSYLSINTSIQAARVLIPCCTEWSDTAEHTDVTLEILDFIVKLAVLLNCVSILACHVLQIIHLSVNSSDETLRSRN
jgi:hypothetical protein